LGDPAAPRNQRGAALYQKLLTEFQKNPPQGLPPDAARFGITKGTPEEWARFGVSVAHAESGFDPKSANTSDPGGSFGVFQYAHNQVPGGNAYDVDASVQAFVRDANKSAGDLRGLRGGILGQRFSTIGKHPERGAAYLSQASELGGSAAGAAGHIQPGAVSAVGGADPRAFIFHHTSGRGSIEGLKETLRQRHLGVEYAMDREGNIVQIGGPGSSHMKTGWGPLGSGLSNRNTVGMEVIAKNDRDVTPAQVAAAKLFMERNYPNTPVFGHGQVNPGHKEADEGMSIVNAVVAGRRSGGGGGSSPVSQDQIERARNILNRNQSMKVEGSGKISVDVNAPKGTRVGAQGKGLFKTVEINRQTQMEPAKRGPADAGEE
jgi:hypothetical protein